MFSITGNLPDFNTQKFNAARLTVRDTRIYSIEIIGSDDASLPYILPGFVDSHVHIESSMLVPSEFARLAVVHGTVATVSDPHEIANVCGINGVQYMIDNAATVNFKFYFGAPSCVPATMFESAGDVIDSAAIEQLLSHNEILYLSEMMNFPGVIHGDKEVLEKISIAHQHNKPIDGHAPGVTGEALRKYVNAGISTDHECFTRNEALEKLKLGMKVIIREGSAARNFDALIDLLNEYPDDIMFCSDDKHPDSLVAGHINVLCKRAAEKRIDVFRILKAACINPVLHYKLDVGLLKDNDAADFILVRDLQTFAVEKTFINGTLVADNGSTNMKFNRSNVINHFNCDAIKSEALVCPANDYLVDGKLPVIEALDGQLITNKLFLDPKIEDGLVVSDTRNDILKIVVVNRYHNTPPAISFIKNFGLTHGAIASSVAHDSHNVIAVGADDVSITEAVNMIIQAKGGISCVSSISKKMLALPVAGLMSVDDGYQVAEAYTGLDKMAKELGSSLQAPFMTLSFMALLVIPVLKLSDKGLFDGSVFKFVYGNEPDS